MCPDRRAPLPVFGFTPDRLAEIRSHDREGDFYDALLADGGEDVQAFLTTLTGLRGAAADMSVCRLLWHIYNTASAGHLWRYG